MRLEPTLVRGRGERRAERWWWLGWCVLGALPFAFMKTFERYMLALLCPMLALAVHRFVELSSRARRVHLMIAVGLLTVPAAGFALFVLWFGLALWAPLVGLVVLALAWRTASRDPDRPLRTAIALAATMMVLLGGVYPSIGINALPDDLPADLATTPVATFARSQPGMLSIATGHSVRQLDLDADGRATALRGFSGYVFVADEDAARFEAALAADGIRCERRGEFRSFYSRKTWLKFQRPGIGWSEWKQALTDRSTEVLQPVFVYYRLPGTD